MFRYAQIDSDGIVVSDSHLSGDVIEDNMISIADDFDLSNKKYVNGEWVAYTPPVILPTLSDEQKTIYDTQANTEYLVCQTELQ